MHFACCSWLVHVFMNSKWVSCELDVASRHTPKREVKGIQQPDHPMSVSMLTEKTFQYTHFMLISLTESREVRKRLTSCFISSIDILKRVLLRSEVDEARRGEVFTCVRKRFQGSTRNWSCDIQDQSSHNNSVTHTGVELFYITHTNDSGDADDKRDVACV